MSKNMKNIQMQINELEKKRAQLLPLRKDEIFAVLTQAGGLTLDNKLIAGLAVYASNPANKDSQFLRELEQLGKKKIPSKRNASAKGVVENNKAKGVSKNAIIEGQNNG